MTIALSFTYRLLMSLVVVLSGSMVSLGQEAKKINNIYTDLTTADKSKVIVLMSVTLSLQYHDYYGTNKHITLLIRDEKGTLVASLALEKKLGLNYYNIDLNATVPSFEVEKTYSCLAKDEVGRVHELLFRCRVPKPANDLMVEIFVNPKVMQCDNDPLNEGYVEFFGSVANGKAPYVVNWYVLNAERTDYLYQPKTQAMPRAGSSAMITVDKSPDYFVIMDVIDACGNEQYRVVQVTCEEGEKKVNTVFFESIGDVTKTKKIN